MSKLITLSADEKTATVADATIGDIFKTVLSSNSAVTGVYGFVQKAGLAIGGAAVQNMRVRGNLKFWQ